MITPRAGDTPQCGGTIRSRPEDFHVDEVLGFEPDGEGEHLFVQVEKTGANTAWVATQLAGFAGVAARDVSYAGRKDRHAVTRQWFSLWLPGRSDPAWNNCDIDGVRIIRSLRNGRKLRRGALAGNRFVIVVRELNGPRAGLEQRLGEISSTGVPNYFGPQRFGRAGSNIDMARRWFSGAIRLKGNKRSMALSAARSALFNAVLAQRLRDGSWLSCLRGEALNPQGRGGFFVCDSPDEEILKRIASGSLHITGPLWGSGEPIVRDEVAALESAVISTDAKLATGLAATRLDHDRRALRVIPENLTWELGEDLLTISFGLPKGAYATGVLAELLNVRDAMNRDVAA